MNEFCLLSSRLPRVSDPPPFLLFHPLDDLSIFCKNSLAIAFPNQADHTSFFRQVRRPLLPFILRQTFR